MIRSIGSVAKQTAQLGKRFTETLQCCISHKNLDDLSGDFRHSLLPHPATQPQLGELRAAILQADHEFSSDDPRRMHAYQDIVDVILSSPSLARDTEVLDDTIAALALLVERLPVPDSDHPTASALYYQYGGALMAAQLSGCFGRTFVRDGSSRDLDGTIAAYRNCLILNPKEPSITADLYGALGDSLEGRFDYQGRKDDLEDAIASYRHAIKILPITTRRNPSGSCALRTYCVVALKSQAAQEPATPPLTKFGYAYRAVELLELYPFLEGCFPLLRAYECIIEAYPQARIASLGKNIIERLRALSLLPFPAKGAAAAAIASGQLALAVEWLEEGRNVVWGQIFRLRHVAGELSEQHPDIADRLAALSRQLESVSMEYSGSISFFDTSDHSGLPRPVLSVLQGALQPVHAQDLLHITWCLTGPLSFLPLHAAGIYNEGAAQVTLMDFAVSSYTPSIEVLLRSKGRSPSTEHRQQRVLAIAQPYALPNAPIPSTLQEVRLVRAHFPDGVTLENENGTVDAVLAAMVHHSWVHLACHGMQDSVDPTQSSFALHDHVSLKLSQLMSLSLENAELAFLSACQTATGNATVPDEAVHLAAGMLTAGFRSVVGTM
ncbi:CHAT domain-containing protein [Fomitopsis serialis]|uniref:CHAT domain-containing protein n=1 Tax=Fomitopsis serialis TaxID=139415 RepID=UPI002007CF20|nr:CHAT domain-containing protein [Neoantrodia serialis]KAH9936570.1 CHAT domain-containing protein [Neoantrodia serialis]